MAEGRALRHVFHLLHQARGGVGRETAQYRRAFFQRLARRKLRARVEK